MVFLGGSVLISLGGFVESRMALEEFKGRLSHQTGGFGRNIPRSPASPASEASPPAGMDSSLGQIAPKRQSLGSAVDSAVAVLSVPKVGLEVPVFANTSRRNLNRGAGWIEGTATPASDAGTIGIAGHRDGYFRKLKDLAEGDEILLATQSHEETFVVDRIRVVEPRDRSPLAPKRAKSLTLVTCYPFYYVGPAPNRFVVEAHLRAEAKSSTQPTAERKLALPHARNLPLGGQDR